MVTFVGAEYIIANALIALKKNCQKDEISLKELSSCGVYIQKLSLDEGIDAIFLSSLDQLASAVFDFSDYFEYIQSTSSIRIKKTKQIRDLENRFIGYLPFDVLSFLVKATNKFAKS